MKRKRLHYVTNGSPEHENRQVYLERALERALKRNHCLENIVIINPSPDRIASLFTEEFEVKQSMLEIKQDTFRVPSSKVKSIL